MSSLTNIGASNMRLVAPTGKPSDARHDPGGPSNEARRLHPAPDWISRWQQTATVPASRGPWVTGYRFWRARLAYEDGSGRRVGPGVSGPAGDWIDVMHKGGHQRRHYVPETVANAFVTVIARNVSIGRWLHQNLLENGRNRYPGEDL
jgi:hypothetical protein